MVIGKGVGKTGLTQRVQNVVNNLTRTKVRVYFVVLSLYLRRRDERSAIFGYIRSSYTISQAIEIKREIVQVILQAALSSNLSIESSGKKSSDSFCNL